MPVPPAIRAQVQAITERTRSAGFVPLGDDHRFLEGVAAQDPDAIQPFVELLVRQFNGGRIGAGEVAGCFGFLTTFAERSPALAGTIKGLIDQDAVNFYRTSANGAEPNSERLAQALGFAGGSLPTAPKLRIIADPAAIPEANSLITEIESILQTALDANHLNEQAALIVEEEILPRLKELRSLFQQEVAAEEERTGLVRAAHRALGAIETAGRIAQRIGATVVSPQGAAATVILANADKAAQNIHRLSELIR